MGKRYHDLRGTVAASLQLMKINTIEELATARVAGTQYDEQPSLPFQPKRANRFVVTISLNCDDLQPKRSSWAEFEFRPYTVRELSGIGKWDIWGGTWSALNTESLPFGMCMDDADMVCASHAAGYSVHVATRSYVFANRELAEACVAGARAAFAVVATVVNDYKDNG